MDGPAWRRLLEGSLGIPAPERNGVDVLRDGVEIFPAMLDAIASAERTVDLLTFVYWRGDIARRFVSVDGEVGIVGSANLNHRSLQLDEEVDLVVFDPEVVALLDRHTDRDLGRCELLRVEDLRSGEGVASVPARLLTGLIERFT